MPLVIVVWALFYIETARRSLDSFSEINSAKEELISRRKEHNRRIREINRIPKTQDILLLNDMLLEAEHLQWDVERFKEKAEEFGQKEEEKKVKIPSYLLMSGYKGLSYRIFYTTRKWERQAQKLEKEGRVLLALYEEKGVTA